MPYGPPRPIKSQRFDVVRGRILDDRTIEKYILAGRYGEARRAALLEARKKKPRRKPTHTLAKTLKLLGL